jgi:hypothetical protein
MTSQRLYEILRFVDSLDERLSLQIHLEGIRDALNTLVNSPAQPTFQSALATALASFTAAADQMAHAITPSQAAAIQEMGGAEFFDPAIAAKVTNSIQTNAMTPAVARDFVKDLAVRRSAFLETVGTAREALEKLGITDSGLKPGTADVAFLIPRDIFDNRLGSFAKELTFISRLIQDYTEARTGEAEPVTLEQLSSSIPTVTLMANLAVLSLLGTVIKKFLDAWEKIEKIRQMRAQLAEMGLKGKALQELSDDVTTTVDRVIEESTELVIANYKGNRKNELSNAVRQDTRRLFGQIERGLSVEFHTNPKSGTQESGQNNLEQIADLTKKLKFPEIANEPLLLGSGEILEDSAEGDVQVIRQTKKVATHKTTTSRKEASNDGKQEGKEST